MSAIGHTKRLVELDAVKIFLPLWLYLGFGASPEVKHLFCGMSA